MDYKLEVVAVPVSNIESSAPGLQVVVDDVEAARAQLCDAGVKVGDVQDSPTGRFVFFNDRNGNGWAVQQFRTHD